MHHTDAMLSSVARVNTMVPPGRCLDFEKGCEIDCISRQNVQVEQQISFVWQLESPKLREDIPVSFLNLSCPNAECQQL